LEQPIPAGATHAVVTGAAAAANSTDRQVRIEPGGRNHKHHPAVVQDSAPGAESGGAACTAPASGAGATKADAAVVVSACSSFTDPAVAASTAAASNGQVGEDRVVQEDQARARSIENAAAFAGASQAAGAAGAAAPRISVST
jgi:hypothetical protein